MPPRLKHTLVLLDKVRIASPCPASWDDMAGDDRTRFCGQCQRSVYNLSAMTRTEAEELVRSKEGNLCAAFFRRADGTILTSDCPIGLARWRRRFVAVATAIAAAAVVIAAFVRGGWGTPDKHVATVAPEGRRLSSVVRPSATPAPQESADLSAQDVEGLMALGGLSYSSNDLPQ